MKLTDTNAAKRARLIELDKGIYLKMDSMSKMVKFFDKLAKDLEDETKQLDAINELFDRMIVDGSGDKFEDLVDNKATDILDVPTIQIIMEAIPLAIAPDPKQ